MKIVPAVALDCEERSCFCRIVTQRSRSRQCVSRKLTRVEEFCAEEERKKHRHQPTGTSLFDTPTTAPCPRFSHSSSSSACSNSKKRILDQNPYHNPLLSPLNHPSGQYDTSYFQVIITYASAKLLQIRRVGILVADFSNGSQQQ